MSACPPAEVLARIAEGDDGVDASALQHVSTCRTCSRHVALLRESIAAGLEDIAEEVDVVDALLGELLEERPSRWDRIVSADARFHRAALARRMLVLALLARESNTRLALAYSESATVIVEALASDQTIADLRFDAWRYHSMLLREIGNYQSCREAFVKAEEAAIAASDSELSLAIIAFSRALLAIEPDVWQPEEARVLLDNAEQAFARKDAARLLQTRSTRGILAVRAGSFEEAASILAEVLGTTPRERENAYADALRNYLYAAIYGHRTDDELVPALENLEAADERAAHSINVLRDRWLRGLLSLNRNEFTEAAALLRETMRGFESKGHEDSAIRAGIDALRALLAAERYEDAAELAGDLASRAIGLDKRQPTRRHTLTAEAISYLREAAQRELLTADITAAVGKYLDRITYQPPIGFVPPMPLQPM